MFGITPMRILKFLFREGEEIIIKNPRKPALLPTYFDMNTGLTSTVTIRNIREDPFISFTQCAYKSRLITCFDAFLTDFPSCRLSHRPCRFSRNTEGP
jgi:hypothetical protein